MKENNEKKNKNCDEISKLIKAFPKDRNIVKRKRQKTRNQEEEIP